MRVYKSGPAASPAVLLATGASVNQAYTPLPSNSVWGAGWYNAADAAHYADGSIHYEGNVDFDLEIGEVTGGNVGSVWDWLMKWAINERAYPRSMDISPDGNKMFQYRVAAGTYNGLGTTVPSEYGTRGAWCSEISFNASTDSLITCSASMMALFRAMTDPAGGSAWADYEYIDQIRGVIAGDYDTAFLPTSPLNPGGNNIAPVPVWRSEAFILVIDGAAYDPFDWTDQLDVTLPQVGLQTIEWNVTDSNNPVLLLTCGGSRLPQALLQGPHAVTGGVTLYHPQGPFDPILGPTGASTLTTPYVFAYNFKFTVRIRTNNTAPATYVFIECPAIYVNSDTYDIPGQGDIVNRVYNISALGGRKYDTGYGVAYALPPMIMSNSSGAFQAPAG